MDQKQFEAMLSDAETRLRRLKMLYEQWFMGFERTEPAVLRRELEELLGRMRKEQSNNTALRFRLQQLVQRHTTFSTYWRRIGRQIEEGTYQRDVLRAKRMRSRIGQERDNGGPELELSYDVDLDDELAAALDDANRVVEAPAAAAPPPPAPLLDAALAPPLQTAARALRPETVLVAAEPAATQVPAQPQAAQVTLPRPGLVQPRAAGLGPSPLAAAPAALGAVAAAGPRPAAPAPAGTRVNGPRSLSPFSVPAVNAVKPAPAKPAPPPPPGATNQPRQPVPPAAANAPAPVGVKQPPAAARVAAQPLPASPRAAPPSSPRPAQPAGAAAAERAGAFSPDDVQRVYTQYLAARKQNAERVDNVRRETIEKTIRGMLPQLEKKHAGKKIDFEVVVKDGKVALKPVAK